MNNDTYTPINEVGEFALIDRMKTVLDVPEDAEVHIMPAIGGG